MRYILDANAVIALLKDSDSKISRRVRKVPPADVVVSSIVAHELFFGAYKSKRVKHNLDIFDALLFQVVEFDKEDAREAGEIRAFLSNAGTPIGPYDVLLAGQAKARGLTVITHNVKEFGRVPGLKVENWQD
ncbi:MAG: type II toxin-antitoxin system VapC family toxin [Candidatus Obscuribacterales bacterium]|jgi:tRNA(fMet)-specific endonuclease VapC